MAGNKLSFLTIIGMTGLALLQSQACSTDDSKKVSAPSAAETEVAPDVLSSIGPNVIVPTLERFQSSLQDLEASIALLNDAIDGGSDGQTERVDAQEKWLSAMDVWQELEVMQLGPAGSSLKFVGGQDIRDEVYSWPTTNACRIDQKTVGTDWDKDDYFSSNLVNAYGLDALEHLLFAGPASVCASQVKPNSDGSWAALGEEGVIIHRAQFAAVLVTNIQGHTENLIELWSGEGENYSQLLQVESENSPYESKDAALNAVFDSLFYLETSTKDRKLAQPLGLRDCSTELCLEDLEGLTSQSTLRAIKANLKGFRTLFTGGEGAGMDDLLGELGQSALSDQILQDIEATLVLADGLQEPFDTTIEEQNDKVMEFYESLALVTTALKGDLATVLSMQIPVEAAGDND